jgi:hypothetical protein
MSIERQEELGPTLGSRVLPGTFPLPRAVVTKIVSEAMGQVDQTIVVVPYDAAVYYDPECSRTYVQAWVCLDD